LKPAPLPIETPTHADLAKLAGHPPHVEISDLHCGYGSTEILRGVSLVLGRGQSLCLIGPNGAGKSTLLHAVYGLADVFSGRISVGGRDVVRASARDIMIGAKVAYVLQAGSVFLDMTVEENLLMGGYLLPSGTETALAVEHILDTNAELAKRRAAPAGALSGGERRLLELSRAMMTKPDLLLIDEPSIGLDPNAIETIFARLQALRDTQGVSMVIVEQNVEKGLQFADIGYLLVSGRIVIADRAVHLRDDPRVGRLFVGL
jgi:branched-chain amino acid transport system ATP-binding protein